VGKLSVVLVGAEEGQRGVLHGEVGAATTMARRRRYSGHGASSGSAWKGRRVERERVWALLRSK
jgi:hypothetical protein